MGVRKEEIMQPKFAGLEIFNYPDMQEASVPRLALFRLTQKLMGASGIVGFSFKDISHPQPDRLCRQLSGAINFARFREERQQVRGTLRREGEKSATGGGSVLGVLRTAYCVLRTVPPPPFSRRRHARAFSHSPLPTF
jgi:hypothetical protein